MARRFALITALALTTALLAAAEAAALPRATADRADEQAGMQIHVMYMLPSDGADRSLDTNGTLANSVASFRTWLATKAAGRSLRLDTFQGEPDVTFRRMTRTDADMSDEGAFLRDAIEADLDAAGFNSASKIYAVYYDGSSDFACGGGAWPPTLPGNVAAMYLDGLPNGAVPCGSNPFAGPGGAPTYMEFAMLHEIMHTMGFVATCAPHQHMSGHVSDDANDLMWAGSGFWIPSGWAFVKLDAGNDDYYKHSIAGCLDLDDSAFLAPFGTASCARAGTTLNVNLSAGQAAILSRTAAGAIQLGGAACSDATVTNVDLIDVNGAAGAETLTLDLANGGFAPGASGEAKPPAEIELDVDLGAGTDQLAIKGTPGVDTVRLGAAGVNLNADADGDLVRAGVETYRVDGGLGNDVISGAAHASVGGAAPTALDLRGDEGNDTLTGGAAADGLAGLDGADTLAGGAGADLETGGAGNDTFKQDAAPNGSDDLLGEAGTDKVDYGQRGVAAPVNVTLNGAGPGDDGGATPAEGDSADVENVTGGAGADSLTGDLAKNALAGGLGNDTFQGGDGVDTLTGGKGDDVELGGPGNDVFKEEAAPNGADDLIGEAGTDKTDYGARTATAPVTVVLDGRATLAAGGGNDGGGGEGDDVGTENVTGGKAGDDITGDAVANLLAGGLGNDILRGLGGNDTLKGDAGADQLFGGEANDKLDGGADTDTCDGGPGTNTLTNCP